MCGIAGIINFNGQPVEKADLKLMTDAIKHRGPDGEGFYVQDNVGFGHRRLAIIDLSEAGAQPMTRFGCTITYNGEIYNYIEVRKELEKKGISFNTKTDTEVILAAYHVWGTECVQRFNGMWAFAIYSAATQEVFLSRDRFGEKPLYYINIDNRFIFCSEIQGILSVEKPKSYNEEMVKAYILFGFTEDYRQTFFNGIFKLPPAKSCKIDITTFKIDVFPYYEIPENTSSGKMSENDTIDGLKYWLSESVRLRLRSDVAVGTCLSGGLDSSAIANIASDMVNEFTGEKMSAITATSQNVSINEGPYAKLVSQAKSLQWHQVCPEDEEYQLQLSNVIDIQNEPFVSPSVIMQYFVMKAANNIGLKVLLDGQGADELFMGYPSHIPAKIGDVSFFRKVQMAQQLIGNGQLSISRLVKLIISERYATYRINYNQALVKRLGWRIGNCELAMSRIRESAEANKLGISAVRKFALQYGSLPSLLRYEDRNSMNFSIEARLPFLDFRLVDYIVSIPNNLLYKNGWSKYPMRKVIEHDLPAEITWRRNKIGFEAPENAWSNKMVEIEKVYRESEILKRYNIQLKSAMSLPFQWRSTVLALWEKKFF